MKRSRVPTNPTTLASLHLIDAAPAESTERQLRREYIAFCEECRRDLDPIEVEFGGIPTFTEWKETYNA